MSHSNPAPASPGDSDSATPLNPLPPTLTALGYDARRHTETLEHLDPENGSAPRPGRVVEEHRDGLRVVTERGVVAAVVAGRLRHAAPDRSELPAVGDWVLVEGDAVASGGPVRVIAVLPRRSRLIRKVAGVTTEAQVVAANVDVVFVASALDRPLPQRALERYVTAVWDGGATPVLVLTKADLVEDARPYAEQARAASPGLDVHVVRAIEGDGVEELSAHLAPARTVAVVGASGAGKSTLVNALSRRHDPSLPDVQFVDRVRHGDAKGRHTTTARRLLTLPDGALLVDTPGMRELGLWDADEGVERAFADIEELAVSCRFHDCSHASEPGCEVRAATEDGRLDPDRLESRRKLERELAFLHRKQDARAQSEQRKAWAKLTQGYRKRPRRGFR